MPKPGLLVIDKPTGPTSHDIVNIVRRGTQIRKVGHTGTLDPYASGVLLVLLGAVTRLAEYLLEVDKEYLATIRFGAATSTFDAAGRITATRPFTFREETLEAKLAGFVGERLQVPPIYSAIKVGGRKAYDLARKGEEVEMTPRKVHIYELSLLRWESPNAVVRVRCSRGTYIRSIAHDIGEAMGSHAHLVSLRRIRLGPFSVERATPLEELKRRFLEGTWEKAAMPASAVLEGWATVELDAEEAQKIRNGIAIPAAAGSSGRARAIAPGGELLAVLEADSAAGTWQPKKVFID
ncbi:MAG: tRNA pseudouridine(55) synthase TruB [Anaerolineales bacterium]|nr:tRNA pseudouridine(55) synthase TruB [Anaerolineales bacterium]